MSTKLGKGKLQKRVHKKIITPNETPKPNPNKLQNPRKTF